MTAARTAATHPAGTTLRCPVCHRVQVCAVEVITMLCYANSRGVAHRACHMQRVEDCTSRERAGR